MPEARSDFLPYCWAVYVQDEDQTVYLLTWSLLLAAMGFFTKSFDPSENVDNWNRTPSMDCASRDCASLTACFKAPVSLLGMLTIIPL